MLQPYINDALSSYNFSDCILSDFLRFYIFYIIGVYGSQYIRRTIKKGIHLIVCSGAIFILFNTFCFLNGDMVVGTSRKIIDFIVAITGSVFFVEIGKKAQSYQAGWFGVIKLLGKESFPIYVLQGFAIAAIRIMITKLGLNDAFGIIPMLICTLFGCTLPLVAYYISTKIWKLDGVFYPGRYINLR